MWVLLDKCVGYRIARRLAYCVRRRGRRFRAIFFGGDARKRVYPNVRYVDTTDDNDIVEIARKLHRVSGGRVAVISWDRALIQRLRSEGIEALTPYEALDKLCREG